MIGEVLGGLFGESAWLPVYRNPDVVVNRDLRERCGVGRWGEPLPPIFEAAEGVAIQLATPVQQQSKYRVQFQCQELLERIELGQDDR